MSVYVSQRFESESIRNLPIRRVNFSSFRRRRRAWEKTKKCVFLSLGFRRENDARERINTYRSGAIDDERLDFLRSFLCCWGHFYVCSFFLSDEILRVKCDVCADDVRERNCFFFRFSFSHFRSFVTSSSLTKKKTTTTTTRRRWFSTWKDWRCTSRTSTCTRYVLKNTCSRFYYHCYSVTIFFVALLSLFPSAHDSDDDVNDDDASSSSSSIYSQQLTSSQ